MQNFRQKNRSNTVFGRRILFRVKEYADSPRIAYRRGLVNNETGILTDEDSEKLRIQCYNSLM